MRGHRHHHHGHHHLGEEDCFFGHHGRGHRGGGHGPFGGGFGRFGGGGFMGGRSGLRAAKMLASGDLQLLILLLLGEKPRHGYEIIKALEEHSSGVYTPSPGMVYPALTFIEESGFAESSTEGTKKLYTITTAGEEHLKENQDVADEIWKHLSMFGRKFSRFERQFNEDEDIAEHFGGGRGGSAKAEWRKIKAEFRELREELKAAIAEKIDASMEEKQRILDILKRAIGEIRK